MLIGLAALMTGKAQVDEHFYLGDKLVAWHSKKKESVSLSTAEAEYIAASTSCTQVLWMRQMLKDLGI